jgi:hypothetical protein
VTRSDQEPYFDQRLADAYVGKYILVGVTYLDDSGGVSSQLQVHGTILSVSAVDGLRIALRGKREGEQWTMPPHLEAIQPAPPGTYTLRSTGERIDDPDLLATWEVEPPDNRRV